METKSENKSFSTKTRENIMNNNSGNKKSMKHKFQQVVVQTLLKKDEESESEQEEEEEEKFEIPEEVGVSLNLSKKKIEIFPEELLNKMQNVQGNRLSELPENFFENLYSLKWLDLRNNSLVSLPTIGLRNHPSLEIILLQGNRIRNLPLELATISSLRGLQTSGNPITNVPYDAIAEGFPGVMKYLRKLCAQDEILLPVSETIVVRPSTSRDDQLLDANDPSDLELRSWDLDKLSQWRQFMKRKSKKLKEVELKRHIQKPAKVNSHHSKISVSMRSQPKTPSKPQPFRCGVYNRNRHRITSSALHFRKLRKTRLGYKRKPITAAIILEKSRHESAKAQMREILEKQAKKIQRMRDKEVLKSWRDHARFSKEQIKLLDNYQQYPSKNFANKTPFDVDPEFLNMLNRVDLYRSLRDYDDRSKRVKKPKARITASDLERQMNEIMNKLKQLDTNDDLQDKSPRTRQNRMCSKMNKIMDIQQTLRNLQTLNSSMSGLVPIVNAKN